MDDEPPAFLAYQPYKGPAAIPHAPADFFGAFFLATNSALIWHMNPGKFMGTEVRARRHDPDYIASCCNEAGMRRDALRGQVPKRWDVGGAARPVADSHERMWWDPLSWKRWKIPRTGPAFANDFYFS